MAANRGRRPLIGLALGLVVVLLLLLTPGAQVGGDEPSARELDPYPWLYLRDGRPPGAAERLVSLIAVGDVMLGRAVADELSPLSNVSSWLRTADLTLGNLESVIVRDGTAREGAPGGPQPYILRAPPTAVLTLVEAGFDLLGLANNHAYDYGPSGLAETAVRLELAAMTPLGAGPDATAASRPVFRQVNGVRLAFLAFNAVSDPAGEPAAGSGWRRAEWDPVAATAAVAAARETAASVIVSIHWGHEYDSRPDPVQERAARLLLDAGADLIIGHHPHVAQRLEVDDGRLIAYSLGNFVFDQSDGLTGQGLALRVFFDEAGLRAVQALPLQAGPRPRLLGSDEAEPFWARLLPASRLTLVCDGTVCQPVEAEPPGRTGLFWSGEIDLTGDGRPEQVRRATSQVTIYEAGTAVWQSPPEWEVDDAALGDPNDDGRAELMLAIRRPDPDGYPRSQPYIVGYREGKYKLLWGGRPVVDPIQELELGDVDGDGVEELVILAEGGDGRFIAVWRWHGWGFSQIWRSENGRYEDLVLWPTGERLLISVAVGIR